MTSSRHNGDLQNQHILNGHHSGGGMKRWIVAVLLMGSFSAAVAQPVFVPHIIGFSPSSGRPLQNISLSGGPFSYQTTDNRVFVGGVRAYVSGANEGALTISVPSGAAYGPVTVTSLIGRTGFSDLMFTPSFIGGDLESSSFAPKIDFNHGTKVGAYATGDLDGDGKPDLVVGNYNGLGNFSDWIVSIYRNTSSGQTISFAPKFNLVSAAGVIRVYLEDMNGDAKLDIVTVNEKEPTGPISIHLNNSTPGNFSFQSRIDFNANISSTIKVVDVAIGDLDRDGHPDLGAIYSIQYFRVYKNSESFSWSLGYEENELGYGTSVAFMDLNSDGKLDVVLAKQNALQPVRMLQNNSTIGTISLAAVAPLAYAGSQPEYLYKGDLDGDGRNDLIVTDGAIGSAFLYRKTTSAFGFDLPYSLQSLNEAYFGMGDVDGDGKVDLVLPRYGDSVQVRKNTSTMGSISFADGPSYATGSWVNRARVADLNNDGRPELIAHHYVGDENNIAILRNTLLPYSLSRSTLVLSDDTVQSGSTITVTLTLRDNNGNVTGLGGPTVVFSNPVGGTSSGSFSNFTSGFGTYTATFRGNAAGTPRSILATIDGRPINIPLPTVTVVPGPVSLTQSLLTISATRVVLNGTLAVSVRTKDINSNTISTGNSIVSFGLTGASTADGTFGPVTYIGNGLYTSTFTGTVEGTFKALTATIDGSPVTSPAPFIQVESNVPDPATSTISLASQTIQAGTTVTVTLLAKNSLGTPLIAGGHTVSFSFQGGGTSDGQLGQTIDNHDGTYITGLYGTTAGTARAVGGTINGQPLTNLTGNTFVVTPGPYSFNASTLSVTPSPVPSGAPAFVRFQPKDALGNNRPQPGMSVAFSLIPPGGGGVYSTGSFGSVIYSESTGYTAPFLGLQAGEETNLRVVVNSNQKYSPLTVAAGSVSTVQSAIAVTLPSIPEGMSSKIILQARDSVGNKLTSGGLTVAFSLQGGGTSDGSFGPVTDHGNGTYSSFFAGSTLGTPRTIGATINGQAITSALPTITVTTGPPVITALSQSSDTAGAFFGIVGENFGSTPGENAVFFGGVPAGVMSASSTLLELNVPSSAAYGQVTVVNLTTGLSGTSAGSFQKKFNAGGYIDQSALSTRIDIGSTRPANSVVSGDLDGDGWADIVVSNKANSSVTIFRNTGNPGSPSFDTPVELYAGGNAESIRLADLDGDGRLEIIVAGNQFISALRNLGTPGTVSFGSLQSFPLRSDNIGGGVTHGVNSLVVADLNLDGRVDAATIDFSNQLAIVLLNTSTTGAVSFAPHFNIPIAPSVHGIGAGDLDGDGKPELILSYDPNAKVVIYRNTSVNGILSFASGQDVATGVYPYGITVADVTADGKPDLLVANRSGSVSILRNQSSPGSITLDPKVDVAAGFGASSISVGDLDGDGRPDLVVNNDNAQTISLLKNTTSAGSASFASKHDFALSSFGPMTAIADLDRDGRPDIATSNVLQNSFAVFLNTVKRYSPLHSVVTLNADSVQSAQSVTATLRLKDINGWDLDLPGETIAFSLTGAGTSTGTFGATTDNGDGTYSADFTGILVGTTKSITASINGTPLTSVLPSVKVIPGVYSAHNSLVSAPATPGYATYVAPMISGGIVPFTLSVKDAAGNPHTSGGLSVSFFRTGLGTSTGSFGATTDNGNGTYTAPFTGLVSGTTDSIGAIINGDTVTTRRFWFFVQPGAPSAAHSIIQVTPDTIQAGTNATLSLLLRDANGNVVNSAYEDVQFSLLGTGTSDGTLDHPDYGWAQFWGNGEYRAFLYGRTAGSPRLVSAVLNGQTVTTPLDSIAVRSGQFSQSMTYYDVTSMLVPSGGTTTVVLHARDAFFNPHTQGDLNVVFTLGGGGTSTGVFDSTLYSGNGDYTSVFHGLTAGSLRYAVVTVNGSGITYPPQYIGVEPGSYSPTLSTLSALNTTVEAGKSTYFTFTARDAGGNKVSGGGLNVQMTMAGAGTSVGELSQVYDVQNGEYRIYFEGRAAGTPDSILVTVNSVPLSIPSPKITVTPGVLSPAHSQVEVTPASIHLGSGTLVKFTARDGYGNQFINGGLTVTFSLEAYPWSGTSNGTFSAVTDSGNGVYTALFTGTTAGTPRVITTVTNITPINAYPTVTVVSSPTISTFTPVTGTPGLPITVLGSSFDSDTSKNIVYFGATRATVTAATPTSLTVTVPASATYAPITVADPTRVALAVSSTPFTPTFVGGDIFSSSSMHAAVDFPIGVNSRGLVGADFDGDGRVDLVTANVDDNDLTIYRNTGSSGTIGYTAGSDLAALGGPAYPVTGDLDADGKLDLVFANTTDSSISFYRNTSVSGTISFDARVDIATPSNPQAVALGDVDGDGNLDIVVGFLSEVRVYRSTGLLSFLPSTALTVPTGLAMVAVADLDGDKRPEIAAVTANTNTLTVFRNTSTVASISFAGGQGYATGTSPVHLVVGDLNNDSKVDLTVANYTANTVSYFRNTSTLGSVSLAGKMDVASGLSPLGSSIADMNGDGRLDLVQTNSSDGTVSVYLNLGGSSLNLAPRATFATGTGANAAVVADLDGDGRFDIAVANRTPAELSVLRSKIDQFSLTRSSITLSASSVASGSKIIATLQTKSIDGANITTGGATVVFLASGGGSSTVSFGPVTDNGNGTYTDTLTGIIAGTPRSIGASVNGALVTSALPTLQVTAGPAVAATSFIGYSTQVVLGQSTTFTLQARDVSGNNVTTGGATVVFSLVGGSPGTMGGTTDNGDGTYTATFSSSSVGGAYISATVNGVTVGTSLPDVQVIVLPPTITNVSAYTGNAGAPIVLTGTGFHTTPSLNTVYFGPAKATVTNASSTSLTASVPLHSVTGPISVIHNGYIAQTMKPFVRTYMTSSGTTTFGDDSLISAGSASRSVAVADFTGDNQTDYAVMNWGENTVKVYRNEGTGAFTLTATLATGTAPQTVVAADFNADGKWDVATSDLGAHDISVYFGNGDGTFGSRITSGNGAEQYPLGLAAGDLNNDGYTDLVTLNLFNNTITPILNFGGTSFARVTSTSSGTSPSTVAVADFNGDGLLDAVSGDNGNGSVGSATVRYGAGNGTFSGGTTLTPGGARVATGDFNKDGAVDIAVSSNANSSVTIHPGLGNGNFGSSSTISGFSTIQGVRVDDFNGDGNLDIAVSAGSVSILPGNGNGTFGSAVSVSVGSDPWGIASADFNFDSRPDLITANSGGNSVSVVPNTTVLAADFLHDPTSIAFGSVGLHTTEVETVSVFNNSASSMTISSVTSSDAQFVVAPTSGSIAAFTQGIFTVSFTPTSAGVKNSNIIFTHSKAGSPDTVTVNGTGAVFTPVIASFSPSSGAIGSTVTIQGSYFHPTPASNQVWFGGVKATVTSASSTQLQVTVPAGVTYERLHVRTNGLTTISSRSFAARFSPSSPSVSFAAPTAINTSLPGNTSYGAAVGDFNNDGDLDLVVGGNADTTLSLTLGNGNGTFGSASLLLTSGAITKVIAADMNGDGNADIVALSGSNVVVLRGNGNGTFLTPSYSNAGTSPTNLEPADFNRDGKLDLAVALSGENAIAILPGNGDGTFGTRSLLSTGGSVKDIAVADLNNDGKMDVVANGFFDGTPYRPPLFFGNGDGTFGSVSHGDTWPFVFYDGAELVAGDFTGDGNTDIAQLGGDLGGNVLTIFYGDGGGGLTFHTYSYGTDPLSGLVAADLNGDGIVDLARTHVNAAGGQITVLIGNGSGYFPTTKNIGSVTAGRHLVAGDFNNDGMADLVSANSTGSGGNTASLFINNITIPSGTTILNTPTQASIGVSLTPTLNWYAVVGAESYHVEVATDAAFTSIIFVTDVATTSTSVSGLTGNTVYHWRVTPLGNSGSPGTPGTRSFTTILPAPVPASIAAGNALSLDGNDDYVFIADQQDLRITDNLTLEAWINPTRGNNSVIDKGNYNYLLSVRPNGTNGLGLYNAAWGWIYSGGTVPLNQWSHVAVVFQTGTNGVKFYLNGSLLGQGTAPGVLTTNSGEVNIGRQAPGSCNCNYFQGQIDEVRIWNIARTAGEISASTGSLTGLESGLVAYYRMNESSGSTVNDATGHGNVGALVSGPSLVASGAPLVDPQPTTVTLTWNPVSGADSYRIQVSTVDSFSTTLVDQTNLGTSSYLLSGLSIGTTYYWRINAARPTDTSAYSGPMSFITIPPVPAGSPTLTSPVDTALDVTVDLTLTWSALANATSYRVQVSTDSLFATLVLDQSEIFGTSVPVTGLINSTMYYWRVSGANAGGLGAFSPFRKFTTIPVPPNAPSLASPLAAAGDQSLNLIASWNAVPGADSYRLQVSTDSLFATSLIDKDSIATTADSVTGLAPATTYYWRVQASNVAGAGAFSSTRSLTTLPGVPGMPALLSPAHLATGQPLTVTLSWAADSNVASFALQISTDSLFSSLIVDQPALSDTNATVQALQAGTVYFWRVGASNVSGSSGFSPFRSFATMQNLLPAPVLALPSPGALDQPTTIVLRWDSLAGADSYQLQLTTDVSFATILIDSSGIIDTSFAPTSLTNSATYFWRVRATDAVGSGAYSSIRSFSTIPTVPPAPLLVAPTDSSTDLPDSLTFVWGSAVRADSYRFLISSDSSFTTTFDDQDGLTDTSATVDGLAAGTTYFWKVRAANIGGLSVYSAVRSFTTLPPLATIPVLATPVNAAADQSTSLTLSWNASSGAVSYRVQVALDALFAGIVKDTIGIVSTSLGLNDLMLDTTYYWRVSASNVAGVSAYSAVRTFTTVPAAPSIPTIALPPSGVVDQSLTPTLVWHPVPAAATYQLQVSTDSLFGSPEHDITGLTDTTHVLSTLSASTTYYWRVKAVNAGGAGNYSTFQMFTTVPAIPNAPALVGPADGDVHVPRNAPLTWNAASGALSYRVQVSVDSLFSTVLFDSMGIVSTTVIAPEFLADSTHFWRVNASNVGGTSPYSPISRFTTLPAQPPSPQLVAPYNLAANQPTTLALTWNPTPGADSYHLQVSVDAAFATNILDTSGLTTTSYLVTGLSPDSTYYWRVNGMNLGGTGSFSTLRTFTTEPISPDVPTVLSPVNGTVNVPLSTTLSWTAGIGGSLYRVQLATDDSFASLLVDSANVSVTTVDVGGLNRDQTYYWRVTAANAGGSSVYTDAAGFTTIPFPPVPPILASPLDSAIDRPLDVTLTWAPAAGAASYRIQIATDQMFSALVVDDSTITDTTFTAPTLATETEHFWRISAANPGGVSAFTTPRMFKTVPAVPSTPTLSTPVGGSLDMPVNVALTWNPVPGATFYRLQVDTNSNFTNIIVDHDSLASASDSLFSLSRATTYYWQVRSGNPGGVSAYSAPLSFTTIPEVPPAPVLLAPADSAIDLATAMLASWDPTAGATFYHVQVASDEAFSTIVIDDDSLNTSSDSLTTLTRDVTYFWRVRAGNTGGLGTFSSVRQFRTVPFAPSVPALAGPADQATDQPVVMTLNWDASSGAVFYHAQVATDTSFASLVADIDSIVTTSIQVDSLDHATTYFWRVLATNTGGMSEYAARRQFTTIIAAPASPALVSPVDSALNQPVTLTLGWDASVDAAFYRLQIATDSAFATVVSDIDSIVATSRQISGLANATTFYWRVRSANVGGVSAFATPYSFTTMPEVPAVPVLATPSDSSIDLATDLKLEWASAAGATSYRLQAGTDPTFTSVIFDRDSLVATSDSLLGLVRATTYFWRVEAENAGGVSGFSTARSFTTLPDPPAAPILVSPADSASSLPVALTLEWDATVGADSYRLQLASDSAFGAIVLDVDSIGVTFYDVAGLSNNSTYFWRVNATNTGGTGAFANPRRFTTILAVPAAPTLTSPSDSAIHQPTTLTLSWNAASGAASYRVQVATDSQFTAVVADEDSLVSTFREVAGLSNSVEYFWRVSATNAGGTSAFSDVRRFETIPGIPQVPTLATPLDSAVHQPTTVTLSWNAVAGADAYRLQVASDSVFSSLVADIDTIAGMSYDVSGLANSTVYFWRLRGMNAGGVSGYSDIRRFTTIPAVSAVPTLASPLDSAVHQPTTMILNWSAADGADSYQLQVATDSVFSLMLADIDSLAILSHELTGLANSTTYFWRVRSLNAAGSSGYSVVRRFTTIPAVPSVPVLASPLDSTIHLLTTVTLSWTVVDGAELYRMQVASDSVFSDVFADIDSIPGVSYNVSGLTNATVYFWRVRSFNAGGASAFSGARRFTTIPAVPATPVLASPLDSAVHLPTNVAVSWDAVMGADLYRVQIASDVSFSSIIADVDSIPGVTHNVTALANSTTYFWRVRSINAGGVSAYSSARQFTTIPAVPAVPALLTPADSAIHQPTTVSLSWSAAVGAEYYEVRIATDSAFTTLAAHGDSILATSYEVTGLANATVYYWSVRSANVGGAGVFAAPRHFMTIPAVPSAPQLAAPSENAIHLATTLTVSWNTSAGAEQYRLQVATDSTFGAMILDADSIIHTSYELSGLSNGTTYHWRVRSSNVAGSSPYSDMRTFTTIPAAPGVPILASPADSAIHVSTTLTLNWNAVAGADHYRLQYTTDSLFSTVVSDIDSITGSSHQIDGLFNSATYLWRVLATNAGGSSAFSDARRFTTIPAAPTAPTLVSPADSAVHLPTSVTLVWNASAGATMYQVQVSTDTSFTTTIFDRDSVTATGQSLTGLAHASTYHWRVRASNVGGTSSFSGVRRFTTIPSVPDVPVLTSPADSAVNQPISLTLTWNAVAGADMYRVQASSDSLFTTLLANVDTVATSLTLGGLSNNTRYYWRVSATNAGGTSQFSQRRTFTTTVSTSVEVLGEGVPRVFALSNNYPNPFNPDTKIEFSIPENGRVILRVYDIAGREVATLFDGEGESGVLYRARFNASNLPTGMYFARLQQNGKQLIRRMLLIK